MVLKSNRLHRPAACYGISSSHADFRAATEERDSSFRGALLAEINQRIVIARLDRAIQ
jgi:hypothetical protein